MVLKINEKATFSGELFGVSEERANELAYRFEKEGYLFLQDKMTIGEVLASFLNEADSLQETAYMCFTAGILSEAKDAAKLYIDTDGDTVEDYYQMSEEQLEYFNDSLVGLKPGNGKTPLLRYISSITGVARDNNERMYLMYKAVNTFMIFDQKTSGLFSKIEDLARKIKEQE